jgi:hypothetical protein
MPAHGLEHRPLFGPVEKYKKSIGQSLTATIKNGHTEIMNVFEQCGFKFLAEMEC